MKKIPFLFLLFTCLFVLCGCFQTSAAIENAGQLAKYESFRFPVKFYIENVTQIYNTTTVETKNKKPTTVLFRRFHQDEEERWMEGLHKYWPELFTKEPGNALKVRFSIEICSQKQEERNISGLLGGVFISSFSFGLFPAVWHEKYRAVLRVQVEALRTRASLLTVKTRTRGNNAFLGLWYTRYLVPKIADTLFETNDSPDSAELRNCRVREDRLKDFLQLFVAELHRFPPEKIQELYLSKKTEKVKLLE